MARENKIEIAIFKRTRYVKGFVRPNDSVDTQVIRAYTRVAALKVCKKGNDTRLSHVAFGSESIQQ